MKTLQLPTLPFARRRIGAPQRGWIGVDFGARATKLAQVVYSEKSFRIAARSTLAAPTVNPAESATSMQLPSCMQLKATRKLFRGCDAAVTLPMSVVSLRTVDAPPGEPEEIGAMIEQDLLADLPDADGNICFDFWEVPAKDARANEGRRYSVLAAPRTTIMQYADALTASGFDSRVMDGLPCALARAAQMADPSVAEEPTAAIDLAFSSPLFVIASNGQPIFVRQLRGCDIPSFTKPLCEGLEINLSQAEQLLGRFGVRPGNHSEVTAAEIATHRLAAQPLDALTTELQRTLSYISQQLREYAPRHIWLFGGGATWSGMAEHLAEKLETPTSAWRLPGGQERSDRSDALFGAAVALSCLAEGASPCI